MALHPPLSVGPGPAGGWLCSSGTGRAPAAAAERDRCQTTAGLPIYTCWLVSVYPPRLSPPTSGLARRGRRWGAQLEGDVSFHCSPPTSGLARRGRRRFRAWLGGGGGGALIWTGSLLSTPLAADFVPGPEKASEGCAPGSWVAAPLAVCHLLCTPLAANFGPGPEEAAAGRAA